MNPFQLVQTYKQKKQEPPTPQPATRSQKAAQWAKNTTLWRIVTDSAEIQQKLVDMVNELGDMEYGDAITHFANRDLISASISKEMAMAIARGSDPDYILLYKPGINHTWALSEKHSRGDLRKYLGREFEGYYSSATSTSGGRKI